MGPMFRAERPQAGAGASSTSLGSRFGSASPFQDVEVILLLSRLLEAWALSG